MDISKIDIFKPEGRSNSGKPAAPLPVGPIGPKWGMRGRLPALSIRILSLRLNESLRIVEIESQKTKILRIFLDCKADF